MSFSPHQQQAQVAQPLSSLAAWQLIPLAMSPPLQAMLAKQPWQQQPRQRRRQVRLPFWAAQRSPRPSSAMPVLLKGLLLLWLPAARLGLPAISSQQSSRSKSCCCSSSSSHRTAAGTQTL